MPGIKEQQFYKEDYKTRDYGSMMHEYEKHLQHGQTIQKNSKEWAKKKAQLRKWTEADQLFEDQLWVS